MRFLLLFLFCASVLAAEKDRILPMEIEGFRMAMPAEAVIERLEELGYEKTARPATGKQLQRAGKHYYVVPTYTAEEELQRKRGDREVEPSAIMWINALELDKDPKTGKHVMLSIQFIEDFGPPSTWSSGIIRHTVNLTGSAWNIEEERIRFLNAMRDRYGPPDQYRELITKREEDQGFPWITIQYGTAGRVEKTADGQEAIDPRTGRPKVLQLDHQQPRFYIDVRKRELKLGLMPGAKRSGVGERRKWIREQLKMDQEKEPPPNQEKKKAVPKKGRPKKA